MNTLELNQSVVLTKKEKIVRTIMEIDDEFLLEEIEEYLSEIITSDDESEDWDTLSPELQEGLKESIHQSETGQAHKLTDVIVELRQLKKQPSIQQSSSDEDDDWHLFTPEQQTAILEAVKDSDEHPENRISNEIVRQNMARWRKQ